ncbi:MAG TPA: EAL domain-containing protein [Thermomicrobiales bacterium]|nr:EAL domain-containing protein [Thermomicrobiales bacterium]
MAAPTAAELGTVLIVEDDAGIAALERRRLERAGYTVAVAATAEAALARVRRGDLDLAVLDQSLPGGATGLGLYAQLQAAGHDLPVIIVTGHSHEALVIEALRLGVQDFVTKSPAYLDYLPEAVARVLGHVRTARRLAASEERFRALVQHASDLIRVVDAAGIIRYASPAIARVLGYTPAEVVGRRGFEWVHPDDAPRVARFHARVLESPGLAPPIEVRLRHRDGSWRRFEVIATNLLHEPSVGGIVLNARDITERTRLEAQLRHQAFHDALTGLANRALFVDRLGHALARAGRHGERIAVLYVDLDRFKVVNDSLGHPAGDALLGEVAQRLRRCLRAEDTLARLGGDEFTILVEELADGSQAARIAGRIAEEFAAPCAVAGQEVFVAASVGIALNTPDHAGAEDLLRDADIALYRAKRAGGASYALFDPSMNAAARERLALESELHRAVGPGECREFRLHYQPLVELATGRVAGLEALVRWQLPARGLVPPAAFIPLAEETGLIVPLGSWVLREACRQGVCWRAAGPDGRPLAVSVNLSARQILHRGLVAEVAAALAETGLPPAALTLEITETTLMVEAEATRATLADLRALGVRLAIDDFGTGYSSLAYLKRFPVDTLKLDKAFVAGVAAGAEDTAIVAAVVALARALGCAVTAEGVETAEAAAHLRRLGCALGQGYHFARPLPADEFAARFLAPAATPR